MKRIIMILTMLLVGINLYSQDFEPSQHKFYWSPTGNYIYLSADMDYFKQKDFLLGWHWGGAKKISQSLLMNHKDVSHWNPLKSSEIIDSNCYVTWLPPQYTHGGDTKVFNVRAIQFEPTLNLNPNAPHKLNFREGDTTRPIFGFLHRRGRIIEDPTDENYSRLMIDLDSLKGEVILTNAWKIDELFNNSF